MIMALARFISMGDILKKTRGFTEPFFVYWVSFIFFILERSYKRSFIAMTIPDQKYPIGRFQKPAVITQTQIAEWIATISAFPETLFKEVVLLSDAQLDTPYREGGWTIRQVVHHCADSHMNAFCRFKLALTEHGPVIKPYFEDRWAELPDSKTMSIDASLSILEGLHFRFTVLMESQGAEQLRRFFIHPEHGKQITLEEMIGMYAWHCRHHLAHITTLKKSRGWK